VTARRLQGEDGASLVEYALLMALIVIVCVAAVTFVGKQNGSTMDNSASRITTAG
jgi:Flp pilus assembly pilin Flp